jgi:hypothetical protein
MDVDRYSENGKKLWVVVGVNTGRSWSEHGRRRRRRVRKKFRWWWWWKKKRGAVENREEEEDGNGMTKLSLCFKSEIT